MDAQKLVLMRSVETVSLMLTSNAMMKIQLKLMIALRHVNLQAAGMALLKPTAIKSAMMVIM